MTPKLQNLKSVVTGSVDAYPNLSATRWRSSMNVVTVRPTSSQKASVTFLILRASGAGAGILQ